MEFGGNVGGMEVWVSCVVFYILCDGCFEFGEVECIVVIGWVIYVVWENDGVLIIGVC